jgi:hypothetical protein
VQARLETRAAAARSEERVGAVSLLELLKPVLNYVEPIGTIETRIELCGAD